MEKVLLPAVQAERLKELKTMWTEDTLIINFVEKGVKKLGLDIFEGMPVSQFARAVINGHEVEKPMFEVGDKVVNNDGSEITKGVYIATFEGANHIGLRFLKGHYGAFVGEKLRHATPEEIYWLETLGRKKIGEFQVGDIMLDKDGDPILYEDNTSDPYQFAQWYSEGDFLGLYPAGLFKPFPQEATK